MCNWSPRRKGRGIVEDIMAKVCITFNPIIIDEILTMENLLLFNTSKKLGVVEVSLLFNLL